MRSREADEHRLFIDYMKWKYPGVIFRTDLGGIKMTPGQARKHATLQEGRGYPDIFVAKPMNGFHGLFIELKASNIKLKKRDGSWSTEHVAEQAEYLSRLREVGYDARFAVGYDEAVRVLREYMGDKYNEF